MCALARRHGQSFEGDNQPSPRIPLGGAPLFRRDIACAWRILSVDPWDRRSLHMRLPTRTSVRTCQPTSVVRCNVHSTQMHGTRYNNCLQCLQPPRDATPRCQPVLALPDLGRRNAHTKRRRMHGCGRGKGGQLEARTLVHGQGGLPNAVCHIIAIFERQMPIEGKYLPCKGSLASSKKTLAAGHLARG